MTIASQSSRNAARKEGPRLGLARDLIAKPWRMEDCGEADDVRAVTYLRDRRALAPVFFAPRRLVLWFADIDVHTFLGNLAGDTWNVDLNDGPRPLVI